MSDRVLVTGCMGRLGRKLVPFLRNNGYEVIGTDRFPNVRSVPDYFQLELTEDEEIFRCLEYYSPDVIINTAAMTNVDLCENERDMAYQINTTAPRIINEYAFRKGAYFIQLSTDYVFDGTKGPYSEFDEPKPVNFYGVTKLEAEKYVLAGNHKNAIVRTCVLFGYEQGVVLDFVGWLVNKLRCNERVKIVMDQFSTPTSTDDLTYGIFCLLKKKEIGIFHISGIDYLSRYEFACLISEIANLNVNLIEKIDTVSLKQTARRPLKGGLLSDYTRQVLQFQPKSLVVNLKNYFLQEKINIEQ
ncbi:MAG: dTDP-4-dehydrorhamnose reductase [bacterium]|nr:dTDP-4-dehydrorhamnose reductase [bacterium]